MGHTAIDKRRSDPLIIQQAYMPVLRMAACIGCMWRVGTPRYRCRNYQAIYLADIQDRCQKGLVLRLRPCALGIPSTFVFKTHHDITAIRP